MPRRNWKNTYQIGADFSPGVIAQFESLEDDLAALSGGGGAGTEFAYAEKTSGTTISATTSATSNTVVTAAAVTLDGLTKIRVVFSSPSVSCGSTAISGTYIGLFDGSTCLANIALVQSVANLSVPVYAERVFIPSAGSHTYSIRGYRNDQNGIVFAGTGGADTTAPAFIRVLTA